MANENDDKPDNMYESVRAAMEQVESGGAETVERQDAPAAIETPEASEAPADTRARDEGGRFAKGQRETLKLKEAKAAPVAAALEQPAAIAPNPLAPEIDKEGKHLDRIPPPVGWKGGAKTKWDQLPRPVREEIAADYAQVESAKAEMLPLKQMFDENRDFLISKAGSVTNAMGQMMQFARLSSSVDGARQLAHHILTAQGIDPRSAFSGQPQASTGPQTQDPQALLAQLIDQRLEPVLGQFRQQQTQQLDNVKSQVSSFMADPAYPYFNDVAGPIQTLLETGMVPEGDPATRLKTAYDMAVHMNPTIRAQLQSAAQEAEAAKRAADAKTAQAATRASLRGSPIPGGQAKGTGSNQSVHDVVRAAMEDAGA